ncbi:hypothetical protein D6833_04850 [Candidatus Parcubacteria bacterium]|nr:MAG: hypothetical protein D6833_04850 [Candidatus Parcubacteria bacterium]
MATCKTLGWVIFLPCLFLGVGLHSTLAQSSANFAITKDVLDAGGVSSLSTNYALEDCLGQPSPGGTSVSSSFVLSAGYLATVATNVVLAMNLPPGWSWISFNVQPPDLAVEKVMASMTHLVIMVNGAGQFYIPNVINAIGNVDVKQGYKVYCDAADQLTFQGTVVPEKTPIPLTAGWNFVAYLPAIAISPETALNSVLQDLAIVKDDQGKFFIPGVIDDLGSMRPKEGYKFYMRRASTLVYP